MERIGIFLAEGFEEIEALTVVDILRRAALDIEMVSMTGKREVTSSHNVTVLADMLYEEMDFDTLDMMVLPGGMPGTKNLEAHDGLMHRLDEFAEKGKYIAAICAAPRILGHRNILIGKKACCFPEFESHLDGAEVTGNPAEISGNIITARGMGCSIDFALAIIEKLRGRETAEAMADKIVYAGLEKEQKII